MIMGLCRANLVLWVAISAILIDFVLSGKTHPEEWQQYYKKFCNNFCLVQSIYRNCLIYTHSCNTI